MHACMIPCSGRYAPRSSCSTASGNCTSPLRTGQDLTGWLSRAAAPAPRRRACNNHSASPSPGLAFFFVSCWFSRLRAFACTAISTTLDILQRNIATTILQQLSASSLSRPYVTHPVPPKATRCTTIPLYMPSVAPDSLSSWSAADHIRSILRCSCLACNSWAKRVQVEVDVQETAKARCLHPCKATPN